jgi:hypothetical protein
MIFNINETKVVTTQIELKPCPFCGEELEIIAKGQYYSHKREENSEKQCFGAVWVFPIDDEEMIRRWNTRKPMDDVLKLINRECQGYFEAGIIHKKINNYEESNIKYNKYKVLEDLFEKVRKVIRCD